MEFSGTGRRLPRPRRRRRLLRAVKGRFPFDAVCAGGDAAVKLLASADGDGGSLEGLCVSRRHVVSGVGGVSCRHMLKGRSALFLRAATVRRDAEFQRSHDLKEESLLLTLNDRMSLGEDVQPDVERIPAFDVFGTDTDVDQDRRIKFLEWALEEEKAARAALHQELESERNAAASTADETTGESFN